MAKNNLMKMYENFENGVDSEDAFYEDETARRTTKKNDPSKKRVRKDSYISLAKKAAKRAASTESREEEVY